MKEILVKFKGRDDLIKYTMAVFKDLMWDKNVEYILDAETGEILLEELPLCDEEDDWMPEISAEDYAEWTGKGWLYE